MSSDDFAAAALDGLPTRNTAFRETQLEAVRDAARWLFAETRAVRTTGSSALLVQSSD